MNNKLLVKGSALPATLFCTALMLVPLGGASYAKANTTITQQTSSVKGTVVDSNGDAIIGASVVIVGQNATQGTVTDFDGNFLLKVKPGTRLKISYLGFKSQTVIAKDGMKVTMKEDDATNLKAVEVVAYGTQKKVTVTGALSSVKSEDLVRTPTGNVNNVLGGQLSGVTTVQYSGEPGSDAASVFVRGKATFNGASPLVQVDGVERSMSDVDPEEIESITVLKDASATAVFGVRGANGVILITTKRGAEGKTKISASTSWGILTPTKMVEQADSYQYATFYNQMEYNDYLQAANEAVAAGSYASKEAYMAANKFSPSFSDNLIQKFKDGSDPIRFPSIKWTDYIMKKSTLQTKHNLNISGGTKTARYFINIGYFTQGGLFKEFDQGYDFDYRYNRFNFRANLDLDVTKTTTISFNAAGSVANASKPYTGQGSSGMISECYHATPFSSPGIIGGKLLATETQYDGVESADQLPFTGGTGYSYLGGFMKTVTNKLQFDLQLRQKLDMITKGLSFKIKGSYNSDYNINKNASAGLATYYPVLQADGSYLYKKSGENTPLSYAAPGTSRARNWYFETSLNYSRSFGLHSISGLLLYNQSKKYYPGTYSDIPSGYVGLVGRVTYDWNNRYMVEFNVGYNGSENFAPGKRYGLFPAVSGGWVVSDEPFFKPLGKIVSFMKLRASYGLVGNDQIGGTRFMYMPDEYTSNDGGAYTNGGYAYNFGINNATFWKAAREVARHNPDVTWEHAYKQDYGVDMNFLKDRLRASFDYYYEHRTDILLTSAMDPNILGFTMPATNDGIVNSWGYEISLKWQDKIGKDFRYWVGGNLSYNQNEVIERMETPAPNNYQLQKGHRLGARSQYQFWRFYDEDTPALYEKTFGEPFPTQLVANIQPGDAVYVDLDHNGLIDGNDMTRGLGYTDDPEYMVGLNLGFSWKGLSVNTQWTGAWNVSRMVSDVFRTPFQGRDNNKYGGLLVYHLENTWTADNPSQSAKYPRASWKNNAQNYAESTLYEQDAKYLRLKTLQIAYDFHAPFMKKMGMNQLQLALSGYNLLTFTPYIWGDPEVTASRSPTYPLQRTYMLSLKVGF